MGRIAELRRAWREAVDNFWHEMEASGDPAGSGVYRQVAGARSHLERLDHEIGETRLRLKEEKEQAAACDRRERMARDISDAETARIAAEYGARHRERAGVLERKVNALDAERRLCRRDLDEMEKALHEGRVADTERPELDDLNAHPREGEFRNLEDAERGRSADARLEDLKRRIQRDGG